MHDVFVIEYFKAIHDILSLMNVLKRFTLKAPLTRNLKKVFDAGAYECPKSLNKP